MAKRPRLKTHFGGYTQEHLVQILKSVALRPECDRTEFVRKLNEIAWHSSSWEEIMAGEGTPSERERRFRARAKQTAELADWLEELYLYDPHAAPHAEDQGDEGIDNLTPPSFDVIYLENAARRVTEQCHSPEGEELGALLGNLLDQEPQKRLWKLHELLPWLKRCCDSAADRVAAEKAVAGGNRASQGVEFLIRRLIDLFSEYSAEQDTAYKERISHKVCGHLVDFIETCLVPLEYEGSRDSILDAIMKIRRERGRSPPASGGVNVANTQ